jgi:hypothetical protein
MALPNFLCLGAQRCGTTTLHVALSRHPDVFVPRHVKEPSFFSHDTNYYSGLATYERQHFAEAAEEAAIGEVSPEYLHQPAAAERIERALGQNLRLIVVLRHPVDRAFSQYRMNYSWFWETLDFEQAVAAEGRDAERSMPRFRYLERGHYAAQLRPYLERFGRERMLCLCFETELRGLPGRTLDRVWDFLGVRRQPVEPVRSNEVAMPEVHLFDEPTTVTLRGERGEERLQAPVGSALVSSRDLGLRIVRRPSPELVATLHRHLENRPGERLEPGLRDRLYREHFADERGELESLTGLDLGHWEPTASGS